MGWEVDKEGEICNPLVHYPKGLNQSLGKLKQELRLHQGLSCGAEPEDLSLLLPQAYYLGVSSKVEQLGIQPAPKWDASLTDRIFTHCVTTLAPDPVI